MGTKTRVIMGGDLVGGIVYAFTAANGVLFALFFPVLTGVTIPRDYAWNVLKWLPDWPF